MKATKGTKQRRKARRPRQPLSRERVLRAAIALADREGIGALSMRKIGQELSVEAMSLYNHVANKDDILDGMVDLVVGEIELPNDDEAWKAAMRRRAASAHEVFLRHPWAAAVLESRVNIGPQRLRYSDSVIGTLRKAGFPIQVAYHAFLTLDSYIYGFTLQEVNWAFDITERDEALENIRPQVPADDYPYFVEMMEFAGAMYEDNPPSTGYTPEFEFGLELILEGLEERLERCS